jgi:hypothetical protein
MSIKQFLNKKSIGGENKKIMRNVVVVEDDTFQRFYDLIEPYKTAEYIPSDIINDLLTSIMPSSEVLHSYTPYHKIIKVKISDILEAPITNWQYNRPPDLTRCYDIARYHFLSKNIPDNMLYFAFNNKQQKFNVIDGIHRYTSLKIIKEQNSKPLDILTPGDFGSDNDAKWLYDSYMILNIRFNATEGDLIELFKALNKSSPIPDLYIRDVKQEKRNIIENIANTWQVRYKEHFSSSNKPTKPNINRDRFIDLLEILYDKHCITEENKNKLGQLLDDMNFKIKHTKLPKGILTQNGYDKCNRSGCWLFIYKSEEIQKMI